ncbi:hypothetical protein [Flammeovirga aprica]|uniref:MORN repeat protein n=1 Tax=Flammeovirga aprica JL-4 TaxID=694437 RepID=A0A7X9RUR8_9BACT|nr:hypothetical protein [Flammeovirga aprica]NME69083.1 hypothetical protein [Flammeovirga aprica JL-4]
MTIFNKQRTSLDLTYTNRKSIFPLLLSILFTLHFSYVEAQISENPDKDNYVGQFNGDGKRHGHGTYTWEDGTVYQGKWRNDLMEGSGKLIFANGNSYEGNFEKGVPYGMGIYQWANGDVYQGGFLDGKMHGRGVLVTKGGERHEGTWIQNEVHGEGIHYYANGSQYIGSWSKGKRNGKGIMLYINGDTEQGMWVDDKFIPCDCMRESISIEQAYKESEAVFIGKVFEIQSMEEGYDRVGMIVSEYWKGSLYPSRKVYLRAEYSSCDFVYFEGDEYLVYAHPYQFDKTVYYPTKCTRTMKTSLPLAQNDIKTLRKFTCTIPEGDDRKVTYNFSEDPVCGCDGKDYKNPYNAYKAGVGHWFAGTCEEKKKLDAELAEQKSNIRYQLEEEKKKAELLKKEESTTPSIPTYNYVEEE